MVRKLYFCPECDSAALEPSLCVHPEAPNVMRPYERLGTDIFTRKEINESYPVTLNEDYPATDAAMAYNSGYQRGYEDGKALTQPTVYDSGHVEGFAKGYEKGLAAGEAKENQAYNRGHDAGYAKGLDIEAWEAGWDAGHETGRISGCEADGAYISIQTDTRLRQLETTVSTLANRIGELENEAGSNRTGWLRQHEADILKLRDQIQELSETD